jgi:hypothetical protein
VSGEILARFVDTRGFNVVPRYISMEFLNDVEPRPLGLHRVAPGPLPIAKAVDCTLYGRNAFAGALALGILPHD